MADIPAILREQLREALEVDRLHHLRTPAGRAVYCLAVGQHEDPIDADLEIIWSLLMDAKEARARRDLFSVNEQLERLMRTEGVTEDDRTKLGMGLLQIEVQALEQSMENLKGGVVDPIELEPVAVKPTQ